MNKKFFVINEERVAIPKEEHAESLQQKELSLKKGYEETKRLTKERLNPFGVNMTHVENRIVVVIDTNYKDSHKFEDGTEIYIGRRFNNLNFRETSPVNAWVVSGEDIPQGAEILIHPHAICDTNKINGYESISQEQGNSTRYYSIETISAYLWRKDGSDWQPLKGFATAYRVFEPYKGIIEGILPKLIKNVLYIRTGEHKGNVAHTLKASDYEIIFMDSNGRENRIIRCRNFEDEWNDRQELIGIDHNLTDDVNDGILLIGLSPEDCKKINQL